MSDLLDADGLDAALDGMYALETRKADLAETKVRAHIAALEKERDEAALVVERVRGSLADAGVPVAASPQEWLRVAWLDNERRKAEKGRDAVLADNAALKTRLTETAQRCIDNEEIARGERDVARRDAASLRIERAVLLEEHRKALVRARNEGLEQAAQASDDAADEAEARAETASASPNPDAANWDNGAANEARNIATRIRAKKEPEPTEPA